MCDNGSLSSAMDRCGEWRAKRAATMASVVLDTVVRRLFRPAFHGIARDWLHFRQIVIVLDRVIGPDLIVIVRGENVVLAAGGNTRKLDC